MNPDGVMIYLTGHATLAGCQLAQQARLTENRTSGSIAGPTGLREQHAAPADPADHEGRTLAWGEPQGSGLATRAHMVPFQCRMRVCSAVPLKNQPTAQALAADFALTPVRPAFIPRLGLATWVH